MTPLTIGLLALALILIVVALRRRAQEKTLDAPPPFLTPPPSGPASAPQAALAPAEAQQDPVAQPAGEDAARAQRLLAAMEQAILPAVRLSPDTEMPIQAGGSRIGGPVWLPDGAAWPLSTEGVPLEFLAQVDFAELPPLDGFPREGLLQFFIARGDGLRPDPEPFLQGHHSLLWHPTRSGGSLCPPPALPPAETANLQQTLEVREKGVALRPSPITSKPDVDNPILTEVSGKTADGEMPEWTDEHILDQDYYHQVGGYPVFTYGDFRRRGHFDDFDMHLLRLTSDNYVSWDEIGEACFLIRRTDLSNRDFSRTIFHWESA